MVLSKKALEIAPSMTLTIDAMAKKLKQEGRDVVGFGAGEPDFDTPENIRNAAKKALDMGLTRYTPAAGMPGAVRPAAGAAAGDTAGAPSFDLITSCRLMRPSG